MHRAFQSCGPVLVLAVALAFVSETALPQGEARADSPERYLSVDIRDAKWERMFPEFGADSPEISILRVDGKTQATQLLIRTPKAMHVPKHWHSANETHTVVSGSITFDCDGKRETLGPGSFNYIPGKMAHEAWTSAGHIVFITVDSAWDINWVDGPPKASDIGVSAPAGRP